MKSFIGLIILVAGIGLGYMLWGPSLTKQDDLHMMSDGSMMSQNIDQHFITEMIPHHEGAIVMANTALERSKKPEIISLANGIIEAQNREIEDMKSWYQDWFGSTPTAEHSGMHMDGMTGDMAELTEATDENFDREFLEQMIPHHEMAVVMAQMLAASTDRSEMKILADQIITSQSREIGMMRDWLDAWY